MVNIEKDEQYNWMVCASFSNPQAQIPQDLAQKLSDALCHYENVCHQITQYLEQHPEDDRREKYDDSILEEPKNEEED